MRELERVTLGNTVPATAFASLPEPPSRWRYFGISFMAQAVLFFLIGKSTISLMAPVFDPIDTRESVKLVAPNLAPPKPTPEPMERVKAPPPPVIKVQPLKVMPPPIEVAKVTPPLPPVEAPKLEKVPNPEPLAGPKLPQGRSALVTLNEPARQVQTGGFGDPNGVPPNFNSAGKGPQIPKVGTFDLPPGPGSGNGSGGSKGTPGVVASAGFGNGVATHGQGGSGRQGTVRATDFGSGQPAPADVPKPKPTAPTTNDTPVTLISKPTPAYTPEARQRKVEGEVRLDVEFTASGQVHVLRIVQSLGYGLDQAAVRAAEQIRFSPARRGGQAVDSEGRLSIVFRLS